MIGDDRYRIIGANHLAHPTHSHRRRGVDRIECSADHGAYGDRCHLHTLGVYVDAEHRRAIDLARRIGALGRCSDQLEILGILQRNRFRQRQLGRGVHQLAVAQLASTGRMQHRAFLCLATVRRDSPLLGGSGDKQHPSSSSRLAQGFPVTGHRGRATGYLEAKHGIWITLVIGWRMLDMHLFKADFQLFGNQRRHGGVGPLPHFHWLDREVDPAFAVDTHIGVGREAGPWRSLGIAHQRGQRGQRGQREADQQPAPDRSTGFEEMTSTQGQGHLGRGLHGKVLQTVHDYPSACATGCPAADLMASRMRT